MMPSLFSSGPAIRGGFTRPIVQALFGATCLLSLVSFYTTEQGMALYLAPWFAVMAALGIQVSLVMVAWLVGFERRRSALLIGVYLITALVSVAFSYVSLYNWFSSRERPAEVRRALYDELTAAAGRTDSLLEEASNKGRQYVVALEEMTTAERQHGFISRSGDTDPYLDAIRQAVAKEAQTTGGAYREGAGAGVRYTAFDRYTKLTQQSVRDIDTARQALSAWRASAKPLDASDVQLRRFHAVYDAIPWATMEQITGRKITDRPTVPNYADYVDQSASSQEDLLRAFSELASAPTARHFFSLALAAFIDIVVFLLAFAGGPYFHGNPETLWCRGAAALDAVDPQIFLRGFLAKLESTPMGMTAVDVDALMPGERQYALALESAGLAMVEERDGRMRYLVDRTVQQRILESLAEPNMPLRASARKAPANA